ncbi:MAG: HD domain-containing protein [Firmicutes bacterium]|nr:HD domain-containing protein [Bacillota bacterium]MCL2256475.1 HD domain-containing protein [Bacillota bacterium]
MKIQVPKPLLTLSQDTQSPIYITGGYIRNFIAGISQPTDIDLCGPQLALALMLPPSYMVRMVNHRLGTSIVKRGFNEWEYTPFRTENYPPDGSHTPLNVSFTTDLRLDAKRRDFCMNAIYYDIKGDKVIDPHGGIQDIKNKVIRAIDTELTFSQDGLRLMRLVRFAAETGFKIDGATAKSAMENAHLLNDISPERKRDELEKILHADQKYGVKDAHYRGLKLLHKLGLLKYVIPMLCEAEGIEQNSQYHKFDVLEHIFQCVKFAPPEIRIAALMHDIGKITTHKDAGNFHRHEVESEKLVSKILGFDGLRFPKKVIVETKKLCRNHMYDLMQNTSMSKMRLFIAKNWDIIDKLILLVEADGKAAGMERVAREKRFIEIKQQMTEDKCPITIRDLKIDGSLLVDIGFFGVEVGELLNDMLEKAIIDPKLNCGEWLRNYAQKSFDKKQSSKS